MAAKNRRAPQRPPRQKLDPRHVLAAMGPGMVAALAGADAGGVAAYSNSGALYGYGLLWTVPIMCLLLIVAQETAARMGCVTGKGFASLIREQYGVRLSVLAMLALFISNATVTLCHTGTPDVAAFTRQADVVVVAAGRPNTLTGDMLKPGAVVIDVGVNRVPDATRPNGFRLVGDADFESCAAVASAITPVPGGVGSMTITMLLWNTLESARGV